MPEKIRNLTVILFLSLFVTGFALFRMISPDREVSGSERRKLAQLPEVSVKGIMDGSFMQAYEQYALDQFPFRDTFRMEKAFVSYYGMRRKDNNGIALADGYAVKLEYPLDTESLAYAGKRMQYLYDKYFSDTDANVYVCIIPDKNYYAADAFGYPSMEYDRLFSTMQETLPFAEYIDITEKLSLASYYRTDTHWRQEAVFPVAETLAAAMSVPICDGWTAVPVSKPFYGVYYGQSSLPLSPETLYYMEHPVLEHCRVFDYEENAEIPVYSTDRADGMDAYEMFLSGSKALLTIENPDALTDRELIVFRDSFGSSLVPYLAGSYRSITLVDIRYIQPDVLGRFLTIQNQDVLFLYSTLVLNNSKTLK